MGPRPTDRVDILTSLVTIGRFDDRVHLDWVIESRLVVLHRGTHCAVVSSGRLGS